MLMFFAMFGSIFLLTQYFQFVLGYSPLEPASASCRWRPMMIVLAAQRELVERFGTKLVVATGLLARHGRSRCPGRHSASTSRVLARRLLAA